MPQLDDDVIHDHLPDGTTLGPIPFDDPEKLFELLRERMAPETLELLTAMLAGRVE